MENEERVASTADNLRLKLMAAAHHEAGHLVIAAVSGLPLRPEGLSIDPVGEGLACYCKKPDETDASRERVILATFSGWYAQKRFCEERSIDFPEGAYLISSTDWWEARDVLCKLSDEYLSNRSFPGVQEELERLTASHVEQHWHAIEILAHALLIKEWEAIKPLKSGDQWSKQATAKYVPGDEVVLILQRCGISAQCVSEC